ncbi:MAG: Arabinose 5-phosphate isomerase KpsF [Owenweeksia sp. TMED14]|nr:MAG: Arabinose 5-phosphate isomerase KpsF [Owenweeksia sp. TMED14]
MNYLKAAIDVFDIELEQLNLGLSQLKKNGEFDSLVDHLTKTNCRIVVIGMGKSGHIGGKISASLASTGTHSFFLHPAEAYHGDLGMVSKEDCILLLSNSGETEEILRLFPFIQSNGNRIISIVGNMESTLAKNSDWVLDASVLKEACAINLAPTSSSTLSLILGDCLTVSLMKAKKFQREDFARLHPGGFIGQRLLTTAKDYIIPIDSLVIKSNLPFDRLVKRISLGGRGIAIIDEEDHQGIITDGDLRRFLEKWGRESFRKNAIDVMTKDPLFVDISTSYSEMESIFVHKKISTILVKDHDLIIGFVRASSLMNL